MFNPSANISLIALLCYSVLLFLILRQGFRKSINKSFSLYLLSMIIWSFGSFMIFADTGFLDTLFWNRFMVIGSMGMPIAFFGFAQVFLVRDRRKWLYLGYLAYGASQIANVMGYVIKDAYVSEGLLYNEYGSGIIISSVSWAFFVGFLVLDLVKNYRTTKDNFYRNRIKYLLVVAMVTFAGSLTNATALQVLPVDIAFNVISAFLITYAIIRHQLLDLSVVVRKGLLYSISTTIIGVSYFLVILLALTLFHVSLDMQPLILTLLAAILTALVARPLLDKAQSWIDKLFFREKYDSSLMLQRISNTVASVLELDTLTNMILDEAVSSLSINKAAIFIKQEDRKDFVLLAQKGLEPNAKILLSNRHPLVLRLSRYEGVLTKNDLHVIPQFKALWEQEMDDLEKIEAELFIPLKAKDNLVGIFAVGPKLSEEPYTQDDQLTLTTLANQTAVAVENARLFDAEAKRRQEAELLRKALTELKSDLNLKQVLDNILIHLDEVMPYDCACVFLLYADRMRIVAARGHPHPEVVIGQEYLAKEDALFQKIHRSHRPVILSDIQENSLISGYAAPQTIHCRMGVPLIVRGEVIGCLTLDSYGNGAFSEGKSTLAQDFANNAALAIENARLYQVEREQHELAKALREIGIEISASLDFDEVLDRLIIHVARVVPYDAGNIMLVEDDQLQVVRSHGYEQFGPTIAIAVKSMRHDLATTPNIRYLLESNQSIVTSNTANNSGWIESAAPTNSWIGAPIIIQGKVIAYFSLEKIQANYYQPEHAELLDIFAGQAALALQNARLFNEVQQLAITDELTGISNRRHLFELGEREFNRARRFGRALSVIMMDIDHFKQVNNSYGHLVGDQVLRVFVERCQDILRDVDVLGRYGGEEFTIFLPETDLSGALTISERLRDHIAKTPLPTSAGLLSITASLGVASYNGKTSDMISLLKNADSALYSAKREGRNCLCAFSEKDVRPGEILQKSQ